MDPSSSLEREIGSTQKSFHNDAGSVIIIIIIIG
jgi:hypothetical protein